MFSKTALDTRLLGDFRWRPTRISVKNHGRQSRGRPRPDRRVEDAHDEEPPELRVRPKQNRAVKLKSGERG